MIKFERGIGNITGWVEWITKQIQDLKDSNSIQDGELMLKHSQTFAQMAADVVYALKDGFQISDVMFFGKIVPEIMKIAEDIGDSQGEDKKQFVVDTVWVIYHSIDTGPDGKNNRVKVPGLSWLSSFGISVAEEKFERFVLKVATEMAVEAAYVYFAKDAE